MGLTGFDVNVETDLRNRWGASCSIKRDAKQTTATFTVATSEDIWSELDSLEGALV